MTLRANETSVEFIESVVAENDELFRSVQFNDELIILSQSEKDLGNFEVRVSAAVYGDVGECFKVTAVSNGSIGDSPGCGSMITAFVSKRLQTLEQRHSEFIKVEGQMMERKMEVQKRDDMYFIDLFILNDKQSSHDTRIFSADEMRGVLFEGSGIILERLLAILADDAPTTLGLLTINRDVKVCNLTYNRSGVSQMVADDIEPNIVRIERVLHSNSSESPRSETRVTFESVYIAHEGRLVRRAQNGGPVVLQMKPSAGLEGDEIEVKPGMKELKWEEDMELSSTFRDRLAELKAEHEQYLRTHPDAAHLAADFLQQVLLRKPNDVIAFAAAFFSTFGKGETLSSSEAQSLGASQMLNSLKPERNPQSHLTRKLRLGARLV